MMLLLFILLQISTAVADEIKVRAVLVNGPLALNPQELSIAISAGESHFKGLPITFKVVKIKTIPDICSEHRKLGNFTNQAFCYRNVRLPRFRYGPTVFIAPPLVEGGKVYTAGVTYSGQCSKRKWNRVAVVNAVAKNQDGVPRLESAGLTLAHELGHTYGATHDDTNHNIMNSLAGHYFIAGEPLGFNLKAIKQMLFCPNR